MVSESDYTKNSCCIHLNDNQGASTEKVVVECPPRRLLPLMATISMSDLLFNSVGSLLFDFLPDPLFTVLTVGKWLSYCFGLEQGEREEGSGGRRKGKGITDRKEGFRKGCCPSGHLF